jgi:hypothetical protein
MLFETLKLLGLDVRAKIAQARTEFEQRADLARARVAHAAATASVIALLFAIAAVAGLSAVAVGLSALFTWVSGSYGQFYAYGVVGGVLAILCAIFGAIGILEARSWSFEPSTSPSKPAVADDVSSELPTVEDAEAMEHLGATPHAVFARPSSSTSGRALSQPLALILSKIVRLPVTGNPVVDDMITALREPARTVAEDAIDSAADVIRYGERHKLIAALGTAMFVGWLLERVRWRQSVAS